MADQIGIAGNATYQGVPTATITWGGVAFNKYSLPLNRKISYKPEADVSEAKDKDGEIVAFTRRNKGGTLSIESMPVAANMAAAQTLLDVMPGKKDRCIVTCSDDAEIATPSGGSSLVEDCEKAYTPDGEAIVTFTIRHYTAKVFTVLT